MADWIQQYWVNFVPGGVQLSYASMILLVVFFGLLFLMAVRKTSR